jgi:GntR family transcriptional regulator
VRDRAQIRIDLNSAEPAYRQVASQVRALIVEGVLLPGVALPAVRRLAMDLGVHFNTVAEAYRQLADEGLIEVSQGKPARVLERRKSAPDAEAVKALRQRLRHMVAEMRAAGMSTTSVRAELHSLLEGEE